MSPQKNDTKQFKKANTNVNTHTKKKNIANNRKFGSTDKMLPKENFGTR